MKRKRKKTMKIILIIFVVLLIAAFAASWFLAAFVMTGNRQTLEEAFQWQSEHYDTSFYGEAEKTDYEVSGYGGYILHVEKLACPDADGRYVIISHGYTDNRMGALKYAKMYLDLGYNCIIYDLRGHGENEESFTTYGILEGQDLAALIKDTRDRYPDLTELGIHGESLGAATTVMSLKYKPDVDFAVADCGFSDIEGVLKLGYRNAHVPVFLVDLADIGARVRYHYAIKDMRPIDALSDNTIPLLFIHGSDDEFIIPQNSQDMYDRTKGVKEIHMIDGAGHAESILTAPDDYRKYVAGFLASVK